MNFFLENVQNKYSCLQVGVLMNSSSRHFRGAQRSNVQAPKIKDLDSFRQIGDPAADEVIEEMMSKGQHKELYGFFAANSFDKITNAKISSQALLDFVHHHNELPEWTDQEKFSVASKLFRSNGNEFLFMLGIVSLPYCFAAAKGAMALYHTEKIRKNTDSRLLDTTSFIVDIMREDAFAPNGLGFLVVKQVRMRHAMARCFLQQKKELRQLNEVPINQEDMAGTNLAFSYVVLREMHKVGLNISVDTKNAYLHFWAVIGHLLGIQESILPADVREAFWLEKRIAHRHFYPSFEGKALIQQLITHYAENIPKKATASLIKPMMRYLLGKELAATIGIESKISWNPADLAMNLLPVVKRFLFPPVQSFDQIIATVEMQKKQMKAAR